MRRTVCKRKIDLFFYTRVLLVSRKKKTHVYTVWTKGVECTTSNGIESK